MCSFRWNRYYSAHSRLPLSAAFTLQYAMDKFRKENITSIEKKAVDLGCGGGIDSLALLNDGWKVTAIDKEQSAIDRLSKSVYPALQSNLIALPVSFEEAVIPSAFLINATFSLPFSTPVTFPVVWKKVLNALLPGGRFAGHFFGLEDSWSVKDDMTFHTPEALKELFTSFSIEHLEETKREGKTIGGAIKRWHVYHIVARYK